MSTRIYPPRWIDLPDGADGKAKKLVLRAGSGTTFNITQDGDEVNLEIESSGGGGGGYTPGGTDVAIADGGTGASSAAAARTNLGLGIGSNVQAWSANLDSYAAVAPSAFGLSLIDDANAAAARTTLGLAIGSNVQAWSTNLDSYATVAPSAFGLSLIDDANAAAARSTLGLVIGAAVQAWSAFLDALAGLATNGLIARTGSGAVAARTITGTSNQVLVSNGDGVSGNPTLSLPQDIHTGARPTFTGANFTGGLTVAIRSINGAYTLTSADYYLSCNAAGGGFTVTLPALATSQGWMYEIKNSGAANNVTLDGAGAELIDGAATKVLGPGAVTRIIAMPARWESR